MSIDITIEEMEALPAESYELFDIRGEIERAHGILPNSTASSADVLMENPPEDKEKKIIICCSRGQISRDIAEELQEQGFAPYYVDHTIGLWPQAASGEPWSASMIQSTGDPIADMHEDMAAEQKARTTYDNILRVVRDIPEIADPIRFLRAREVVHFQRIGEALRSVQEQLDANIFFSFNPSFDCPCEASCKNS